MKYGFQKSLRSSQHKVEIEKLQILTTNLSCYSPQSPLYQNGMHSFSQHLGTPISFSWIQNLRVWRYPSFSFNYIYETNSITFYCVLQGISKQCHYCYCHKQFTVHLTGSSKSNLWLIHQQQIILTHNLFHLLPENFLFIMHNMFPHSHRKHLIEEKIIWCSCDILHNGVKKILHIHQIKYFIFSRDRDLTSSIVCP